MPDKSVQEMLANLAGSRAEAKTSWRAPMPMPAKGKMMGKPVAKAAKVDVKKLYPSTMSRKQVEGALAKLKQSEKSLGSVEADRRLSRLEYLMDTAEG